MSAPPKTVLTTTPEEEAAIRQAVRTADLSLLGPGARLAGAAHIEGLVALLSDPAVSAPIYDLPRPINPQTVGAWIEETAQLQALGDGEGALIAAQKSLDVFVTGHDHYRETYSLLELGKAQILVGRDEEGLASLERVLEVATDSDSKDFEFILEIERRIAGVLTKLGRTAEADEISRRLEAISEVMED